MQFLTTLKKLFRSIAKVEEELRSKDFIRVENVRMALNISSETARNLLEFGAAHGKYKKIYLIYSPVHEVIIEIFENQEDIPQIVYDEEHEENESFAFIKSKHSQRFIEVAYKYA